LPLFNKKLKKYSPSENVQAITFDLSKKTPEPLAKPEEEEKIEESPDIDDAMAPISDLKFPELANEVKSEKEDVGKTVICSPLVLSNRSKLKDDSSSLEDLRIQMCDDGESQ
jgi:hypothetical protein